MNEKRSGPPGRRSTDCGTCVYHCRTQKDIKVLMNKSDTHASKHDVDRKLDKWVFTVFVSSVSAFIIVAMTAFGWLALEEFTSQKQIFVLSANQQRLMKYFHLEIIHESDEAKEILKNGDKDR